MGIITRDTVRLRALEHARSVISLAEPEQAATFEKSLNLLMQKIVTHPNQDAAWTYSKLNSNGAPLEFTFTTLDDEVRYTVEVGGPDLPPADRLQEARMLITELGAEAELGGVIPEMQALQAGGDLRWGAWLGVRHQKGRDQHKLYCEVPGEGSELAKQSEARFLAKPPPGPPGRQPRLVAIGQPAGAERREFYYHVPGLGLGRTELGDMMAHVGLEDQLPALWQLLLDGRPGQPEADDRLPDIEFGLSFSVLPGCGPPVFSIFAFAADYVGGDALVRHRALLLAKQRGWSLGSYVAMTQPIARQTMQCAHHNVLAFIVGPSPVLGMHVSLSPPSPSIDRRLR